MKLLAALALTAYAQVQNVEKQTPTRPQSKSAKIAVVGGGIGGIYTAYKLSKKGYKDITIFEKSGRLGGKAQSLRMSGHHLDIGTYHWTSASYDWIYETAEELNLPLYNYVLEPEFFSIYQYPLDMPDGSKMRMIDFLSNPMTGGEAMMMAKLASYKAKFKEYLGYSNDAYIFPDMTTNEQMAVLGNMTFAAWLQQNDLMEIYPFCHYINTNFLYGVPEAITAYHGLLWTHPGMIEMLVTRKYATYVPYTGFQGFVETMALDQNLHVIYNANVKRISRQDSNKCTENCVHITFKTSSMSGYKTKDFDFLINAVHPEYHWNERRTHMALSS